MNDAMGVDYEQSPFADAVGLTIHAIKPGDLSLGFKISKQREMQFPIPGERRMAPRPVNRDAKKFCPELWNPESISL